jgi:20S proteasome alpha/beta subunit
MTLVGALFGAEGILLAADSRVSFSVENGQNLIVDDDLQKIEILSPHCAMAVVGADRIGAYFLDELRQIMRKKQTKDDTAIIANELHKFVTAFYGKRLDDFAGLPRLNFIFAGYRGEKDRREGVVYTLDFAAKYDPQLWLQKFGAFGCSNYAFLLARWLYKPNLTMTECIALAALFIVETARMDTAVGGPIRMLRITAEGCEWVPEMEIETATKENELIRSQFNGLFFARK